MNIHLFDFMDEVFFVGLTVACLIPSFMFQIVPESEVTCGFLDVVASIFHKFQILPEKTIIASNQRAVLSIDN